ncbi:hypothetical protein [Acutalibacter muris]|uniref:hypothetical protein n=1 Tax=Acutalibacter muris TaxID=1796620 RepID=UPI001C3E9518|nr:hypothetical protein [Acutalibacter muris]
MAKKKQENPLEELEKSYAQWQQLYEHGGSDPFWPDGVNLDLVRNHIIYFKGQIEETCPLYMADELYLRELPPEVDQNYMANPERIRVQARQSLKAYLADPNYQYLLRHRDSLSPKQSKELCVGAVLGYVSGLREFIASDNLVEMRRHREPERYLESFQDCAERVRQALESAEPNLFALAAEESDELDMDMTM